MSCGISKSGFLNEEAERFENWLNNNYHGTMSYMERNFDKRLDTTKLVEGSKSVISLLYNYYPKKKQNPNSYKISKYAYGIDYHYVIKDKLKNFVSILKEKIGDINGRVFVDSAPILERAWAKKSGLGWIGKNTNLISKKTGSFFFIAEIIIDVGVNAPGIKMSKASRKKLNNFIKEVDGFKSVKLISNKRAEFILKDDSKKIIDF